MCVCVFLNSASWGAIPSACFVRCTIMNNNNNNILIYIIENTEKSTPSQHVATVISVLSESFQGELWYACIFRH